MDEIFENGGAEEGYQKLKEYLKELKKYRETELTPEKLAEIDKLYHEKCKELAKCRTTGRKQGKWIIEDGDSGDGTYAAFIEVCCSCCGLSVGIEGGQYGWYYGDPFPWKYCPECGAEMEEQA